MLTSSLLAHVPIPAQGAREPESLDVQKGCFVQTAGRKPLLLPGRGPGAHNLGSAGKLPLVSKEGFRPDLALRLPAPPPSFLELEGFRRKLGLRACVEFASGFSPGIWQPLLGESILEIPRSIPAAKRAEHHSTRGKLESFKRLQGMEEG